VTSRAAHVAERMGWMEEAERYRVESERARMMLPQFQLRGVVGWQVSSSLVLIQLLLLFICLVRFGLLVCVSAPIVCHATQTEAMPPNTTTEIPPPSRAKSSSSIIGPVFIHPHNRAHCILFFGADCQLWTCVGKTFDETNVIFAKWW
jgi:hypothetical protein